MYRVTNLTDAEIRKIGDAYADYTYSEGEVGMMLAYKDRQAVSDYICYGNMHPKLVWGRTKTLGHGGDVCDFKISIKEI